MPKKSLLPNEIVIYKSKDGGVYLDVELKNETVWLSQSQMAELFGKTVPTINEHIKNVFLEGELAENSTIRKFRIVRREGSREVAREIDFYNLDVIISVGYRVNSLRGTQFRIWATNVLKNHLVNGFTLNQKRLLELKGKQLNEFEQAVMLVKKTIDNRLLAGNEAEGILRVITDYANSWVLLLKYDKELLTEPAEIAKGKYQLTYDEAVGAIKELKNNLLTKKEASELFGTEKENNLSAIIGSIYQTFAQKDLYNGLSSKAAHLLYFIIKDHPFTDGNKRIASFLFIIFLARNKYLLKKNGEKKINDNALVALALLVAESEPQQKEIMIKLIMNFLV